MLFNQLFSVKIKSQYWIVYQFFYLIKFQFVIRHLLTMLYSTEKCLRFITLLIHLLWEIIIHALFYDSGSLYLPNNIHTLVSFKFLVHNRFTVAVSLFVFYFYSLLIGEICIHWINNLDVHFCSNMRQLTTSYIFI